jgi:hypothetical protein
MVQFQKILGLIVISTILFACTSQQTTQRLNDVSKLQSQVDSSLVVFNTINIDSVKTLKSLSKSHIDYLEKNYHDTILAHAQYVDVYYGNFKLMRKLVKGYDRVAAEIDFSKVQLGNLHKDIENGFTQDSTYQRNFDAEKKAVGQIINSAKTLKDWEIRTAKRHSGMEASIDSIILDLKNQGYR